MTRSKYAIASIVAFTRSTLPVPAEEIKPKGWALKVAKMVTHFSEKTKQNKKKNTMKRLPGRKVFLRSGDGQKVEAVTVAQKMRHAKDEARIWRFTLDEYLTPRLIQSFTSRMASKLKTDKRRSYLEEGITAENQVALNAFVMALKSQALTPLLRLIYANILIQTFATSQDRVGRLTLG